MTRTGKIARLPRDIRDDLNRRLADGMPGKELVAWLNQYPEVQEVMDDYFGGRGITEQNLSEWKKGGYADWLRHEERVAGARDLLDKAAALREIPPDTLTEDGPPAPISDRLSPLIAMVLGELLEKHMEEGKDSPAGTRALLEVVRELNRLRKTDHQAERMKREQHRWAEEDEAKEPEKLFRRWTRHYRIWDRARAVNGIFRVASRDMPEDVQKKFYEIVRPWAPSPDAPFPSAEAHRGERRLQAIQCRLRPKRHRSGPFRWSRRLSPAQSSQIQINQTSQCPFRPFLRRFPARRSLFLIHQNLSKSRCCKVSAVPRLALRLLPLTDGLSQLRRTTNLSARMNKVGACRCALRLLRRRLFLT